MKYQIMRSIEGFELLMPDYQFYGEEFKSSCIVNDPAVARIPGIRTGLNLFNPTGRPANWYFSNGFVDVPAGIRNIGFDQFNEVHGTEYDCRHFVVDGYDELMQLLNARYGDDFFSSAQRDAIKDYAEAVTDAYRGYDRPRAEVIYTALAKLDLMTLAYTAKTMLSGFLYAVPEDSFADLSGSARNLVRICRDSVFVTESVNVHVSLDDLEKLLKLALASMQGRDGLEGRYRAFAKLLTAAMSVGDLEKAQELIDSTWNRLGVHVR